MTDALWPEQVWRARLLCDLDARGRTELERSGRIRSVARGETLYTRGESCDAVYFLLVGDVDLGPREARQGDLFGIEGWVHASAKRGETARARSAATLLEVPVHVLRRALVRAGRDADADPRIVRSALREAIASALEKAGAMFDARDLDALLDGIHSRALAADETMVVDASTAAIWILEGALAGQTSTHARASIAQRPSMWTDTWNLRAVEETWVACLSQAAFDVVHMYISASETKATDARLMDPKRALGSRSLMIIDGDSCIRCGHCVASCASSHEDGIARFVRQGPKLEADVASALVMPGSCGHCDHAVCMVECPTGALARNEAGDVLVRADLCTGCGRCVEVCPWGNVRLADIVVARTNNADAVPVSRLLAIKCDRCEGRSGGPACVDGCPTGAIVRVIPEDVPLLHKWTNKQNIQRRWIAGMVFTVAACATVLPMDLRASGEACFAFFVASWVHSVAKRRSRAVQRSHAAHLAFGTGAATLFARHLGLSIGAHAVSALAVAMAISLASGIFGAVVSRLAPSKLSRLGDDGAPPETLRAARQQDDERTFALLSGAGESLKALWRIELGPYALSRAGVLAMLALAPTIQDEECRLLEHARAASRGRIEASVALPLVVHAVAIRARAVRLAWHRLLRCWVPVHVAASAVTLVLSLVHATTHFMYK